MNKTTDIIIEKTSEEAAKLIPKIYEDGLKPSVQEASGIMATLFGLVNHVLLYKPKLWIIQVNIQSLIG